MRLLVVVAAVLAVAAASPIGFARKGVGLIGRSGIVTVDGRIIPFTREFMDDIVEIGEAGIVTKSGKNVHLTLDLQRTKRDVTNGFTRPEVGSIGYAGAVLTDGTIIQFSPEFIEDILYFGESGIVTKSGKNVQLTADLKRV
ncbi:cuticle protein CP1158-like [Eriocheir sinensis]|uniref:cuticle protein CP1158-like n=1 Tax=Eriocheir sinensis TaxID=95602 RepID=UPI0021C6F17C|nr:cuticle protein CP1158-like [Eriocheir sinensis]